jgi:hypothetical protein
MAHGDLAFGDARAAGIADPADVALCRETWMSRAGRIAPEAEQMMARNECFFALLLLLEVMHARRLTRWRIQFADDGRAYCSTVWIADRSGQTRVYEGRHDTSMLRSLLAVVEGAKAQ